MLAISMVYIMFIDFEFDSIYFCSSFDLIFHLQWPFYFTTAIIDVHCILFQGSS